MSSNSNENGLTRFVNSRLMAPVTETVRTFWNIATWPLRPMARKFTESYYYKKQWANNSLDECVKYAYGRATGLDGENSEGTIPIVAGLAAGGLSIWGAVSLAPLVAASSGLQLLAGAGMVAAAAPVLWALLPVAVVGVAAAVCTAAASVWSLPVGLFKGAVRIFLPSQQEKAAAKLRDENRRAKREAKRKKFDVHVVERGAGSKIFMAENALKAAHDDAVNATPSPAVTTAPAMKGMKI